MKYRMLSVWFLASIFLLPYQAMAKDLNIVVINQIPYGFLAKGKLSGICYEIATAIATEAGFQSTTTLVSLKRAFAEMESGAADVTLLLENSVLVNTTQLIGTITTIQSIILARIEQPSSSIKYFRGKRIAQIRDAYYDKRLSKQYGLIPYPTESYEQGLKMLLANRVDAVAGPRLGLYYIIRNLKLPTKAFAKPYILSSNALNLYLSNKAQGTNTAKRLAAALKRLQDSGTLNAIIDKYSL